MQHKCTTCNKEYSSYKSLWNHIKLKHNVIVNETSIDVKNTSNSVKNAIKYKCDKCSREFNIRQSRWAHQKKCNENFKEENDAKMIEKIEKLEKKIEELEKLKEITSKLTN